MRSVSFIAIDNYNLALIYNSGLHMGKLAYGPVDRRIVTIEMVFDVAACMNLKIENKIGVISIDG